MHDRFQDLRTFVAVVQSQGFNGAAERLGLVKSAVSRRIREMEDRLGVQLLNRTTRNISTTDAGAELYWRGVKLLSDLQDAEDSIATARNETTGHLRIAAPVSFTTKFLASVIGEFVARHPLIELDLRVSDEPVDLVAGGFDLSIQTSALKDSSLVARRIAQLSYAWLANRDYLQAHGRPRTLQDLKMHRGVIHAHSAHLTSSFGQVEFANRGCASFDSEDAVISGVIAGLGVGLLPLFAVRDALEAKKLEVLLLDWQPPAIAVSVVFPTSRNLAAKVRQFINFLVMQIDAGRLELSSLIEPGADPNEVPVHAPNT